MSANIGSTHAQQTGEKKNVKYLPGSVSVNPQSSCSMQSNARRPNACRMLKSDTHVSRLRCNASPSIRTMTEEWSVEQTPNEQIRCQFSCAQVCVSCLVKTTRSPKTRKHKCCDSNWKILWSIRWQQCVVVYTISCVVYLQMESTKWKRKYCLFIYLDRKSIGKSSAHKKGIRFAVRIPVLITSRGIRIDRKIRSTSIFAQMVY